MSTIIVSIHIFRHWHQVDTFAHEQHFEAFLLNCLGCEMEIFELNFGRKWAFFIRYVSLQQSKTGRLNKIFCAS